MSKRTNISLTLMINAKVFRGDKLALVQMDDNGQFACNCCSIFNITHDCCNCTDAQYMEQLLGPQHVAFKVSTVDKQAYYPNTESTGKFP